MKCVSYCYSLGKKSVFFFFVCLFHRFAALTSLITLKRYSCSFTWSLLPKSACPYSVTQSCPTLCDPMDCSPPGPTVLGILQARILEWVAISSSRGSSLAKDLASPALAETIGQKVICFLFNFFA